MLGFMGSLIDRVFGPSLATPTCVHRRKRFVHLNLECHEERVVPSVDATWTDALNTGYWTSVGNWKATGGGALANAPVNPGDVARFDGTVQDNASLSAPGPIQIGQLFIAPNYGGIISLRPALQLQTGGEMDGGTITQVGALEIQGGFFKWTGGTINGSPNKSTLTVDTPAELDMSGLNLTTGDDLVVSGVVDDVASFLTFNNNGGIQINAGGTVYLPSDLVNISRNKGSTGSIANAGTFDFGATLGLVDMPFTNTQTTSLLDVHGFVREFSAAFPAGGQSVQQNFGTTRIVENSTLEVKAGYLQGGGLLETQNLAGTVDTLTPAYIQGDVLINAGTVAIANAPGNYGTLLVTGNFTMNGGTLEVKVQVDSNTGVVLAHDLLTIDGNLAITNSTAPTTLGITTAGALAPVVGPAFHIIDCNPGGLTGDFSSVNYHGTYNWKVNRNAAAGFYELDP